jgi:hypothetical protein
MANNTPVKALLAALGLVAAASLFFVVSYNLTYLKLHRLQNQLMMATNLRGQMNQFIGALGNDLVKYSEKNPAIDPLLRQYGFKSSPTHAAPATARPR